MARKVWKGLKHVVAEGCDRTSEELARISGWLSKLRSDCPELKLLVIGETGVGKSTLINNLLGDELAGVGHKVESATSTIAHYIGEIEGVPVKLYDTPGLGDSRSERDDEYLQEIKKLMKTETIHLIIYCLKMTETRMRRSLIRTFQQYTEIGVEWRKTVIALTFADSLQLPPNLKKKKEYSIIRYFNERLDEWRVEIPKTLASEIALEETTLACISINPTAGDYEDPLPNGEDWYIPFWLNVLDVLPPAARITFVDIHKNNIVYGDKETREEFEWPENVELPPPPPIPEEPKGDKERREEPQEKEEKNSSPPPFKPSMQPSTPTPLEATTSVSPEGPSGVNISISNQAPVNVNPSISTQSNPVVSMQNVRLESPRDSDTERMKKPVIKLEGERRERFENSVGEAVKTAAGITVAGAAAGSLATIGAVAVGVAVAPVAIPVAAIGALGAGVAKWFGWW